ncbi:MAG: integrase [Nocardiopsaceae bacterium]|nr:integrase [Nocardiopsaceae bacterium]
MENITYDVRIYATDVYKGKKVTTYWVRWSVGGERWKEPFRNSTQAESFRSALVAASRKGEAFRTDTGRPVSWQRTANEMSWYDFACKFVDVKWNSSSAIHRRDIGRALIAATFAMIPEGKPGRPEDAEIRRALRKWGFSKTLREDAPDDAAEVLSWLSRNTANVSALANAAKAREVLGSVTTKVDGKPAAGSTARRNRTNLCNAIDHALEIGALQVPANPVRALKWKAPPKSSSLVDRRSVVNPGQARALLANVRAQKPSGPRLEAFFATMYYSAGRPEEVINLGEDDITFPEIVKDEETGEWRFAPDSDGWGELEFKEATPDVGREWTDDGGHRDRRQLKHRDEGETRSVPMLPELSLILWAFIQEFGTGPDGKIFRGVRGGLLPMITIRRSWATARKQTFTERQRKSPLARRVYDLRNAAVSGWLNAGVAPTQAAEWAGHSVKVLLEIYAKCIDGQEEIAKRRMADAYGEDAPGLDAARSEEKEGKRQPGNRPG